MFKDIAGWFNNGGPFMWVILAVFAFAVAVAVERLIFYYFICGRRGAQQVASLARLINEKKVEEAKRVVFNKSDPLSVLLYTAVDRFSNSMNIEEIREGVEEAAIQQVPRLSQQIR
jgi:biopolymer transport protein ExbB/TolQ